jgi:hypothetical protein
MRETEEQEHTMHIGTNIFVPFLFLFLAVFFSFSFLSARKNLGPTSEERERRRLGVGEWWIWVSGQTEGEKRRQFVWPIA